MAPSSRGWALVGGYAVLFAHSIRRHRMLVAGVWLAVVGLSVGAAKILPRRYEVQTTLQAQRTQVLAALVGRATISEGEAPIKQAAETILSHGNLVSLITQTHLVERWKQNRALLPRLKDALWARLFPPPSEKDILEGYVGVLEKQLWVTTAEHTVTIGAALPDPTLALDVVDAALQSFLEARNAAEIATIDDVIGILEVRASESHDTLEASLKELERLRGIRAAKLGIKAPRPSVGALAPLLDQETEKLIEQVRAKQQAVSDLEDFRRRRGSELSTRLEELRALYTEPHPTVLDLNQSLEDLKTESPQLQILRRELIPLEAELRRRGFAADVQFHSNRAREVVLRATALDSADTKEDDDPDIEYTKSQVRHALSRYNEMLGRVEGARLEQDSARAAFKYRYVVIRPAQLPKGPLWPKLPLVLAAGAFAGLLLGVMGAALLDLSSHRILEPWQLELLVGAPVLGQLRDL